MTDSCADNNNGSQSAGADAFLEKEATVEIAALQCLLVGAVFVGAQIMGSYGLPNYHPLATLKMLLAGAFLLFSPIMLLKAVRRIDANVLNRWYGSYGTGIFFAALVTFAAGAAVPLIGIAAQTAICGLGGIFGLFLMGKYVRHHLSLASLAALAATVLLSLGVVGAQINSESIYHNTLPVHYLSLVAENLSNNTHEDSLHLASVLRMFGTYGMATGGLDGVVYWPYHAGVYMLLAEYGKMFGVDAFFLLQTGKIITIPLFFFSMAAFCASVSTMRRAAWRHWLLPLIIASVSVINIFPPAILMNDSQHLSHVFLFSLAMVLHAYYRETGFALNRANSFLFLALPAMIFMAGHTKVPLYFYGGIFLAYGVARFPRLRTFRHVAALTFAGGLTLFVFRPYSVALASPGVTIAWFNYYRWQPYADRFWILLGVIWLPLLFTIYHLQKERLHTLAEVLKKCGKNNLLHLETVLLFFAATLFGSALPILAPYYFVIDLKVFTLAMLLATVNLPGVSFSIDRPQVMSWRGINPLFLAIAFLLLPVAGTALTSWGTSVAGGLQYLLIRKPAVARQLTGLSTNPRASQKDPLHGKMREKLLLIDKLSEIDRLPHDIKKQGLLYIPKSNSKYWKFFPHPLLCTSNPYLGPSLTGMAMLDGLPDHSCRLMFRDYMIYPPRPKQKVFQEYTTGELCEMVRERRFRWLVVLENGANGLTFGKTDCAQIGNSPRVAKQ